MYSPYYYHIEGRYHILLCDESGKCHGVYYKGYARRGMAERIAKKLITEGYCKTYTIYDTGDEYGN